MELTYQQLSDFEQFIVARWAYSVGKPVITDAEYTSLLRAMQASFPDNEYVQRSWSSDPCPVDLLKKINREDLIYEVILTDKTESIPSLNTSWEVKSELSNAGPGTVSMKHDGWNVQASYMHGNLVLVSTRGRASDALDVTYLRDMLPKTIPYTEPCKIVMELTVSKANFVTCSRVFNNASPRSAVSTILANPDYFHLLSTNAFDIHGYDLQGRCKFEVLQEWGFNTPDFIKVNNYDEILLAVKELSDREPTYHEPTDGAV